MYVLSIFALRSIFLSKSLVRFESRQSPLKYDVLNILIALQDDIEDSYAHHYNLSEAFQFPSAISPLSTILLHLSAIFTFIDDFDEGEEDSGKVHGISVYFFLYSILSLSIFISLWNNLSNGHTKR